MSRAPRARWTNRPGDDSGTHIEAWEASGRLGGDGGVASGLLDRRRTEAPGVDIAGGGRETAGQDAGGTPLLMRRLGGDGPGHARREAGGDAIHLVAASSRSTQIAQ